MDIMSNQSDMAPLLDELVQAGYLVWHPVPTDRGLGYWTLADTANPQGHLHRDGNRYWAIDVSSMLPLYQEMYRRIFIRRLAIWGVAKSDQVGLLYTGGLILFWGPEELMAAKSPSAAAMRHLQTANASWVDWLEGWWHQAAVDLEDQVDHFWSALCRSHTTTETLQAVVQCKVVLGAMGVDSLMPPMDRVAAWLSPHVSSALLREVVEGLYLPASGYLAYDVLEMECWRVADSFLALGSLTGETRKHFIRHGLFYLYEALNTDRKAYWFQQYPLEIAQTYSRVITQPAETAARMEEVHQRHWRRRYHYQWARQQIEASVADAHSRQRLLVLHRFLGTARDFDEEKRRLNMKLWRSLFALADGLGVSLAHPEGLLGNLCDAITKRGGHVVIDPVFTGV